MNTSAEQQLSDEIDIKALILPIWKTKFYITAFGAMFALLVLVYQLGGFAFNKAQTASVQVHFDFKGADEGTYPNGTKFSPQELLSGAVLSELYSDLNTDEFSYAELAGGITLKPNFDGAEQLEAVVQDLISKNKGLTTQDFGSAISEYTATLVNQSKTNITLVFDLELVNGSMKRATDILTQIPTIWATQALKDRGVLITSIPPISGLETRMMSDELLVQVNVLSDTHSLLDKHITILLTQSANRTISDANTGQTLSDLSHKLDMEDKYRISILKELIVKHGIGVKDNDWYEGFRDARLGKLERERSSLERLVIVYEDAIYQFNQQHNQLTNGNADSQGNKQATVYAPQYGEDVINTLLQLGSKMADPTYRKELLEEKIALSTRLQKIITEIEFYKSDVSSSPQGLSKAQIEQLINESFESLDSINKALISITNVANFSHLDNRGELYDLVGVIEESSNNSFTSKIQLKVILGFILGCMLATVMVIGRRLLRS